MPQEILACWLGLWLLYGFRSNPIQPHPSQPGSKACLPWLISIGLYPSVALGKVMVSWLDRTAPRQGMHFQIVGVTGGKGLSWSMPHYLFLCSIPALWSKDQRVPEGP